MESRTHTLINLLALQQEQLRAHARLACTFFDREDIHRFRVDYKKARALLRMLYWLEQHEMDGFRMPGPLKQLYQSLGRLRDLQLHFLRCCHAYNGQTEFLSRYLQNLHNESVRIQHSLRGFSAQSIHRFAGQYSKKQVEELCEPDRVAAFAQFQWNRITEHLSQGLLQGERLHQMRKYVKDCLYNLASGLPELSQSGPGKESLAKAASLMGESLDAGNSAMMMERFLETLPPSMHEEFRGMVKRWKDEQQYWEDEANQYMATWLPEQP